MTYQPPIIGYKNLLNFTAYSGPDIGGWIMIVSGCISGLLLGWEQFLRKGKLSALPSTASSKYSVTAAAAVLITMSLTSCDAGPEPMRYGMDECTGCKMTIADQRFGAEIITKKGRVLKFDDLCCMADFVKEGHIAESEIQQRVVSDFTHPNVFLPVESAIFLKNDELKSPMRSDSAAFSSQADLEQVKAKLGAGQQAKWPAVATD
jgi:copper chaperone NosL